MASILSLPPEIINSGGHHEYRRFRPPAEVVARAPAIEAGNAVTLIGQHEADYNLVQERILDLVRKRAGIIPIAKGDSPTQRLNSLRLGTTYPGVRRAALRKVPLESEDQIAHLAGRLLARLKRDLAFAELEMENARSEEIKEARVERRRTKLYVEVADVADHLFETRCHIPSLEGGERRADRGCSRRALAGARFALTA
ncbi:hypothetical protein AB5I41_15025 [Sphingomonas sp. MMS24-JH45]